MFVIASLYEWANMLLLYLLTLIGYVCRFELLAQWRHDDVIQCSDIIMTSFSAAVTSSWRHSVQWRHHDVIQCCSDIMMTSRLSVLCKQFNNASLMVSSSVVHR